MSIPVTMPQLGESIVEGTISKWLVKEGDAVAKLTPLVEIATDKVDTELPSPAAGVVLQILAAEGATVAVGAHLALIGQPGEEAGAAPAAPGSDRCCARGGNRVCPRSCARARGCRRSRLYLAGGGQTGCRARC